MINSDKFEGKRRVINGVDFFFLHGGSGAPVLLLHGHTQTSDLWAPLASRLVDIGHSVIAPDLHGLGRSSVPSSGYDKASMARDFRQLVDGLKAAGEPVTIIGHDLGVFAAYAYAAQFPNDVDRLILMEATVPGVGIWPMLLQQPRTWHFGFYGPYAERLVESKERIYLDRFWDEFAANPAAITEEMRARYTSYYQRPGGLTGAFSHFEALEQDAQDNTEFVATKLPMPVLGIAGSHSLGPMIETHIHMLADQTEARVIDGAGHWLLEEKPDPTIEAIVHFLGGGATS